MKKIISFKLFLSAFLASRLVYAGDVYPSYSSLILSEKEGISFRVKLLDRKSQVSVLAIHGGRIEEGSDVFAEALASREFNFYAFIAMKPKDNRSLHVTSSHFDDPRAIKMIKRSKVVLSVHGFKGSGVDEICFGGRSELLKSQMISVIQKLKSDIVLRKQCLGLDGTDPKNLVNFGTSSGVQIELSQHLRVRLMKDEKLRTILADALRSVIQK
ncbi:MAG: poly-gamma-glutamate hydrolase family protein [Bdellovibrionales bacterium]|nr:poly-gamma-glutamate hydrolase family protein [Oligoflexia bacterium]